MPFAVELLLDETADRAFRAAWTRLADVSSSRYMLDHGVWPHVALAVLEVDALAPGLEDALDAVAEAVGAGTLRGTGVHSFGGPNPVVYAGVELDTYLTLLHRAVGAALARLGLANHEMYRRPRWVPHCTLAMAFEADRHQQVETAARACPLPAEMRTTGLALVSYPPTQLLRRWALT